MLKLNQKLSIETERMFLRAPIQNDFDDWAALRRKSIEFLEPWDPSWSLDLLSRKYFNNWVYCTKFNLKENLL